MHEALTAVTKNTDIGNVLTCIKKAEIAPGNISVTLSRDEMNKLFSSASIHIDQRAMQFDVPFQHRKRGMETKFIIGGAPSNRDQILLQNLAKANCYLDEVKVGNTFEQIAKEQSTTTRRLMQIIDLAFLAPDIVRSIMQGEQPIGLTSEYLQRHPMPSNWQAQRQIAAIL